MHNHWGGSFEIREANHRANDDGDDDRNRDVDRGALTRRQLDEMEASWLLRREDPNWKRRENYVDLGCVLCKRKALKLGVLIILVVFMVIGLPVIVRVVRPKVKIEPPPPDQYSVALHKALMFFDAQKSGWLPEDNVIPWRGNSGLRDGEDQDDVKGGLVGGYYDAGDNMKFHFPMAFSMTLLSWSVIEYSHKYKELGEYDHVRDIIKWGTDYLLLTFNSSATKIDHIYTQVGFAKKNMTKRDDHYCWMRPEDMDYPRPVKSASSASDLAAEVAAALASASIVFHDNPEYSTTLLNGSATAYRFARHKGRRGKYSSEIAPEEIFYNSTDYYDEYIWSATWLFYASGNDTYSHYSTHPEFARHAKALYGSVFRKVFCWDNKLPGAELLLTRLRMFLNPGYPYEKMLNVYHNTTGRNMCSYFPKFHVFNFTRGGMIQLNQDKPKPLQYAVNAAYLASLYADYMEATDVPGFYCGNFYYPLENLRRFAASQVDYVLGKNPMKMSYVVGHGRKFPLRVHHRGASIPNDGRNYTCQGGWMWRDSQDPNPNVITGAMVGGPHDDDNYYDVRSDSKHTEPTLAGNAGLVAALVSLTSTGGKGKVDKHTMFSSLHSFAPPPPPPPAQWVP